MRIHSFKSSGRKKGFQQTIPANPRLQKESSSAKNSSDLSGANGNSGVLGLLRESAGLSSGRSVVAGNGSSARDGLSRSGGGLSNTSRAVPVVAVGLASAGGGLVVVIVLVIVAVGCGGSDHGGSR